MSVAASNNLTTSGVQAVTGAKTFNDQKLIYRNPADTFSLTMRNPAITANRDSWVNTAFSYFIFKDGTTYYAKNGLTSAIDFTDGTGDCSLVLQSCITALSAGGKIVYGRGTFTHLTNVTCHTSGIIIEGEGRGTKLDVTPASGLTDFLTFGSCFDCKVRDFYIKANTNVTNIIHCYTSTPSAACSRGEISGCLIDGTTNTTGHRGIWLDGSRPSGTSAVYFWSIHSNQIINEDIGIHLTQPDANANFLTDLDFAACNTGIDIDDVDENMVSGIYGQSLPTAVVRLNNNGATGGAKYNTLVNIQGEHATAPIVLLEAGSTNNTVVGVVNTGGPRMLDNSAAQNFLMPGVLYGATTPSVTASPYTYTNTTGSPQTVYITGGLITDISHKRLATTTSLFTDTDKVVRLEGNDKVIITYVAAPTLKTVYS